MKRPIKPIREKDYFKLIVNEDWTYFFGNGDWYKLHFAWGKAQKKFIVQALIDLYWPKEWPDILNKFLQWLEHVQNISKHWSETWIFVLYPPIKDATKKQW